ncbi:MAG: replicative DNA helicase [Candidatus Sumerlaeia bacterium]|nr:replicative DNA helicase [Candidatus Sumerlaeia bacterium]
MTQNGQPQTSKRPALSLAQPHHIEAERGVLGAMLLNNEIIDIVVQEVKAEDFYQPAHGHIFSGIIELHDGGQPVDLVLLSNLLRQRAVLEESGGVLYLAGLEESVLTTHAAPELAKVVAEKATLRRLMRAAEAILHEASEDRRGAADVVEIAERLVFEVSRRARADSFKSVESLMDEALAEVSKLMENRGRIPGIPSGFTDLDRMLNGFQRSDLLILAARPSVGKTAFALNLSLNIATRERLPVAIFSLEMGAEQLNARLLCAHSRVPGNLIRKGLLNAQQFESLQRSAADLRQAPIYIDDTPGLSITQLRSRARRLKSEHPDLSFIVVDYLQLMAGPETAKRRDINRQQEVSDISRGLKLLARELHVPVLALSQLSRSIEQRSTKKEQAKPMLSDLRESGAIEQDADIVMFVHRERAELDKDEEGKPVNRNLPIPSEILIEKHRNGPTGSVPLFFFSEYTLFANMARDAR